MLRPGSIPLPLYDRHGLGLLEVETPAGRLVGNAGGIPGFLSMVLSTPDGRRQLGVMINLLAAPHPVYEAFMRVVRALSSIRWRSLPGMTEVVAPAGPVAPPAAGEPPGPAATTTGAAAPSPPGRRHVVLTCRAISSTTPPVRHGQPRTLLSL
jgi:hypothetical protein